MVHQYDKTKRFTKLNWSWEILRKNPDYIRDWRINAVNDNFGAAEPTPDSEKWGLLYFEDPAFDSTVATPFWLPEICPFVLNLTIQKAQNSSGLFDLEVDRLKCKVFVRNRGEDVQHVLFSDGHKTLQLCCQGDDIRQGRVNITVHIEGLHYLRQNQVMLKRLNGLLQHKSLLDHHFEPSKHSRRYTEILRMLSLKKSGIPQRKIAEILFSRKRIEIEWNDPGGYLRDPVRRALRRGEQLLLGKYLDLLK